MIARLRVETEGTQDADLLIDRVGQLLGLREHALTVPEVFWTIRSLLTHAASMRPLVIILDDLQWAQRSLLDLLEHVALWSWNVPLLLVGAGRPQLEQINPAWATSDAQARSHRLAPLSPPAARELIELLLPGIDDRATDYVAAHTGGNPLFVEQMLMMLIEGEVLTQHEDAWSFSSGEPAVMIPATIQALIASRLDRLADDERAVLQHASVSPGSFTRGDIAALAPHLGDILNQTIHRLLVKDLLRPVPSRTLGEDGYAFVHDLVRHAVYDSMTKERRSELHEVLGRYFIRRWSGVRQHDEAAAHHFERAYALRSDLGLRDERTLVIGVLGAESLERASSNAFNRGEQDAAVRLVERGLELVPSGDSVHKRLMALEASIKGDG